LASGRLKKLHWWIRWSDVSRCRKAMWTHFLHPGHRKVDFDEVALVTTYVGEWPWGL
jgi:hypothetical protein